MEKRISAFDLYGSEPYWLEILKKFGKNAPKIWSPHFDTDSEEEANFIQYCSSHGIKIRRKAYWKCTGEALYQHPFHYLRLKDDGDLGMTGGGYEFIDYSLACPGGGKIAFCNEGNHQSKKIFINSKMLDAVQQFDLIKKTMIPIYLISARLKRLMDPLGLTGCEFIPCLDQDTDWSASQVLLNTRIPELEREAKCFQLIINGQSRGPQMLKNARIITRCPKCETVFLFDTDVTPYFHASDLNDIDFQTFREYQADNLRKFRGHGEGVIISSRVIRFLIENMVKGLIPYASDLDIRYGVVEIEKKGV